MYCFQADSRLQNRILLKDQTVAILDATNQDNNNKTSRKFVYVIGILLVLFAKM